MSNAGDPRVLRDMIREAAQDEPPELAWDRMEARLLAEIDERSDASASSREVATSGLPADLPADQPADLPEVRPLTVDAPLPEVAIQSAHDEEDGPAIADLDGHEPSLLPDAPVPIRQNRPTWHKWVAALAVAATLGLVLATQLRFATRSTEPVAVAEPIDVSAVPMAPGLPGARDLSALQTGDVVEAAVGPVAFGQANVLEWTLSAGSRLVVRSVVGASAEGMHVVELESGSLRGSLSSASSTMLVVMTGDTEVVSLAPGSVFNVTRSSRRVVVHLERGSASVGHRAARAEGRVLTAPLVASFSLDGGNTYEVLSEETAAIGSMMGESTPDEVSNDPAERSTDAVQPSTPHQKSPVASLPTPPAHPANANNPPKAVTEEPSKQPAQASVEPQDDPTATLSDAAASSRLVSCVARFRNQRQANAAPNVTVMVKSDLRVQVGADGKVKSAVFNPPIDADMQGCAVFLLRSTLSPGARVVSIPLNLP